MNDTLLRSAMALRYHGCHRSDSMKKHKPKENQFILGRKTYSRTARAVRLVRNKGMLGPINKPQAESLVVFYFLFLARVL